MFPQQHQVFQPQIVQYQIHDNKIRNGRQVRIQHLETKQILHSHTIHYTHVNSSKGQEVTGFGSKDDNDWFYIWKINVGDDIIRDADQVMIQHVATANFLRSNKFYKSPVSEFQEVWAAPPEQTRNLDDLWFVLHEADQQELKIGDKFRVLHRQSGQLLHSHNKKLKSGSKQQEVVCYGERDSNDWWTIVDIK